MSRKSRARSDARMHGWEGWDEYAPFYDWENAQTLGRRDVPFWRRLARQTHGRVLELGSGTGRITFPLARDGVNVVGIDRSAEMLARARARRQRMRTGVRPTFVRGDIRHLPFASGAFPVVLAPYGILQSLLRERDLVATLDAVADVLAPGGTFGLELVADLPSWREYSRRTTLTGHAAGARVKLVESVRQDRKRRLTIFEQEFIERRSGRDRARRFTLAFRTLSVPQMVKRLDRAGLETRALLGDYKGGPWDERAEVWIILAGKR